VKVLVLGATGATGQELVTQAVDQRHDVTALVRNPDKVKVHDGRLRVVAGSVMDASAVADAVDGQDAVLVTLGSNEPKALFSAVLMTKSMGAIVTAMEQRGVSRIVLLSALGAGASASFAPALLRITFATAFRQVGKDKAAGEALLRESNLDWTVVYPPSLSDGPMTGNYRTRNDLRVSGLPRIPRADVAQFMLAEVGARAFSRSNVVISP
jgi:putative NADH-flavin reductase